VADYIVLRVNRDVASLLAVLERLDRASLLQQRQITVPFAKQVLGL
jgi:DnaA family protein